MRTVIGILNIVAGALFAAAGLLTLLNKPREY